MGLLDRFRSAREVDADVGAGFWVTEAAAMQRSIRSAQAPWERSEDPLPVRLGVDAAPDGRVVVLWRNRIVGFAPATHAPALIAQLAAVRPASPTVRGDLHRHGNVLRLWAGPRPEDGPGPPPPGIDQLPPPPETIFGIRWSPPGGDGVSGR